MTMQKGLLGHRADMVPATVISLIATTDIEAGDPLQYDGEGKCKPFAGGHFAGFALGDSSGDSYVEYESVQVLQQGCLWIKAGGDVDAHDGIGLKDSGEAGKAVKTTFKTSIDGALFVEDAGNGELVKARLFGTKTTELS